MAALLGDLEPMLARAAELAATCGVRIDAVGCDPYRGCAQVPLRLATPGYLAMHRRFDRFGPDGRRMMRLTASLQVTVDLLPSIVSRK